MWNRKACAVCFNTTSKLISLDKYNLRKQFNLVSGLTTCPGGGTPEYICFVCAAYVRKFVKFRDKCQRAHYAFQYLLSKKPEVTLTDFKELNPEELKIMPYLSYINLDKVHYEQVTFQSRRLCRPAVIGNIPVAHVTTISTDEAFLSAPIYENTGIKSESDIQIEEVKVNNIMEPENADQYLGVPLKRLQYESDDDFINDGFEQNDTSYENDSTIMKTPLIMDNLNNEDTEKVSISKLIPEVNGSSQNEEYAFIFPISMREAKAVSEIVKKCKQGKHRCGCGWATNNEKYYALHTRMHNKHINGNFHCEICDYHYKTKYMLQCHMSDKHMYKYVCKKCKEVTFDRLRAKQHYIKTHLKPGDWNNTNRPTWILPKGKAKPRPAQKSMYINGIKKVNSKYLTFEAISPQEQYSMVENRKTTKNYLLANFKCELCYKGFRCTATYEKHMAKHNPDIAGPVQCDVCKLHFTNTRKVYKHIHTNHLVKYSCKLCDFFSTDRGQAILHMKWHNNITYPCPHCDKKFMKLSTRLTHLRIKHPSTYICQLCGHSFVSSHGLFQHLQMTHTKEQLESIENTKVNTKDPNYCRDCNIQFVTDTAFHTHLQSSNKHVDINLATVKAIASERRVIERKGRGERGSRGRKPRPDIVNAGLSVAHNCELCGLLLPTDTEATKHYKTLHPGSDYLVKRYMCDICGHKTRQYANLQAHMRTHTQEKPYSCPHCDRKFSMPSNRDRHIVVHTGEKRYQCQHCSRRFTQSSAVKLHIQTVHLKIPYAPWDKKKRRRRKELEPTTAGISMVAPQSSVLVQQPEHKIVIEATSSDYINAYITYADE